MFTIPHQPVFSNWFRMLALALSAGSFTQHLMIPLLYLEKGDHEKTAAKL